MKNSFQIRMVNPCEADLSNMQSTSNGVFCELCSKNVVDLSQKTDSEITQFLTENKGKSICAKLKNSQLDRKISPIQIPKQQPLKYAAVLATSVLISNQSLAQEHVPNHTQTEVHKPIVVGKMVPRVIQKPIQFTIKGHLLNSKTKKPLDSKKFPTLKIYVSGAAHEVAVNPKTGGFSTQVILDNPQTTLYFSIISNHQNSFKQVAFDSKKIKNNYYFTTIYVDPFKDFENMMMQGGVEAVPIPEKQ